MFEVDQHNHYCLDTDKKVNICLHYLTHMHIDLPYREAVTSWPKAVTA